MCHLHPLKDASREVEQDPFPTSQTEGPASSRSATGLAASTLSRILVCSFLNKRDVLESFVLGHSLLVIALAKT